MNDLIILRTTVKYQDDNMDIVEETIDTEVVGDIKDTKRAEFYAAMAANHKATKTIENVNIDDYELAIVKRTDGKKVRPQKAIIDGEEFDILRTYEKGQFNVEIVCEEVDM